MIPGCPSMDTWYRNVPRSTRIPTVIGFAVLFLWFAGFGAWAAIAPLASAVVTSGYFVAIGQNKQIQHLEGGIIRTLLVKEGEVVDGGQTLFRLDDTAAKSKPSSAGRCNCRGPWPRFSNGGSISGVCSVRCPPSPR